MHCLNTDTYLTYLPANPTSNKRGMFFSKTFSLLILAFLHRSCTLRVEIDVSSPEGKQVKLICLPNKLNGAKNNALWEGVKLGIHDLHKLASRKLAVPNIRVNSNRLRCHLKNSENSNSASKKFRVEREIADPCFPGSFTSGQETECILCPRNFYISKEAADSCWPCPEGTGTTKEGASSVDSCVDLGNNDFRGGIGHIYKWIIIIYLLIRYSCLDYIRRCFGRKEIIATKDDTFLMKSTGPVLAKHIVDEEFLGHDENILDRYHIDDSAAKRKSLKFDVDIKGSAVFTPKSSAEIDSVDGRKSKRPRKDTISLIQSSGIKDSLSPEEQSPEFKTASHEFEKNKENKADSQNIKKSNHNNNLFKNNNTESDLQKGKTQRNNYVNESAAVTDNIQQQSNDDENINPVNEPISTFNVTEDLEYPENSESLNLVNDSKHDTEISRKNDDDKIMDDDVNQVNNAKHPSSDLRKEQNNITDNYENSNQVNDKNLSEEIIDKAVQNKKHDNYGYFNQINDLKLNERTSEKAEENKMIDNYGYINQLNELKETEVEEKEKEINKKNSKDNDNITESENLEETSSNTAEKSETQEESSSSGTEKSSTQDEISAQNVKDSKNGISARNSLIAKKNSIFEYERNSTQNENGKTKQNSFYYPSYQNHQVEQIFSLSSFRKFQNNSCKKPSNCIRRSTDGHIHSDESLNTRFRRSSTDSSTSDTNSIAQKWLNNSKRTFLTKSDEEPIRITIEPELEEEKEMLEQTTYCNIPKLVSPNHDRSVTERITIEPMQKEIEKEFEKKLHSGIPQFISSKQGRSVTERTSCSIHQDINSPAPPCHVEIVLLHLPG
ncbi:hypothetical protein HNY73_020541 [Argiope bruennichi]|uniref:Tyrosine-protein kinase ephrin type A/B receptor-like domain-containing protein n=1 Tax=Argiope bruennichi TaxID=94029 RepID=A0A8T0E7Z9_ARGBR|nr:hypothetical protein HNY73_020541 [Argiope bruennichi]